MLALLLAATIQGPADIASLTLASDAVVRAEVLGKETHWGAGGGEIFTTVTLRPLEIWKGEPAAQFSLLVPGGRQGELDQVVQGAALFREGEEVVVFLERRTPGVYQVARMAPGKFTVGAAAFAWCASIESMTRLATSSQTTTERTSRPASRRSRLARRRSRAWRQ